MLARVRRFVWVSLVVVLLAPLVLSLISDLVAQVWMPLTVSLGLAALALMVSSRRREW